MRDLRKEDLTLFQAERHSDVDQAIRLLAMRVAELQRRVSALDDPRGRPAPSDTYPWPERNQG